MKSKRPLLALFLSYLTFAGTLAYIYPLLPERLATHFGLDSQANGWMTREELVLFVVASALMAPLLVLLPLLFAPWTGGWGLNLPHRDHWFSPEQKQSTLGWMWSYLLWLCNFLVLFFTGVFIVTAQANLSQPPQLPLTFWGILLIFIVLMLSLKRMFHQRFGTK